MLLRYDKCPLRGIEEGPGWANDGRHGLTGTARARRARRARPGHGPGTPAHAKVRSVAWDGPATLITFAN